VDAQRSHIYEGEVWGLSAERTERFTGSIAPPLPFTDEGMICRSIFELVVQLNLTDPHSPEFQAQSCESLHDVTRFVHEIVYGEMFGIGTELGDARSWSRKLDIFLPIDLYLIDLGGGLAAHHKQGAVQPSDILSVPLAALLKGMTHEKIPSYGPRSIDLGGFISVMMHHAATAPENEQTFRDPCYAICSDHYLNYTARVGYHFGIVDAYCGKTPNKNYIQLHFRGGGADFVRRNRRARTIAEILTALGLSASVDRDMVNARASRKNQQETAHLLDLIGRLLQFVRQIDAAMSGEDRVALYRDAFLNEDYDLTQTGVRKEAGPSPLKSDESPQERT
jgi:pyruvate,water dikinase